MPDHLAEAIEIRGVPPPGCLYPTRSQARSHPEVCPDLIEDEERPRTIRNPPQACMCRSGMYVGDVCGLHGSIWAARIHLGRCT